MALGTTNVPLPYYDPIATPPRSGSSGKEDKFAGLKTYITDTWVKFFTQINQQINAATQLLITVGLTTQSATIAATQFNTGVLTAGVYEFRFCTTVTQAATVSSSLIVGLQWTYNGQNKAILFTDMNGNTIATANGACFPIHIDGGTPVLYSAAYASVGATPMQYAADFLLSQVGT
jgi:hypothetical protein